MHLNAFCNEVSLRKLITKTNLAPYKFRKSRQIFRIMKLVAFLLIIAIHVSAKGVSQITLSEKNAPLKKVFKAVENQSGYVFFYDYAWLQESKSVSIKVKNASLTEVLNACFKDQPLTYSIIGKTIVVKQKEELNVLSPAPLPAPRIITGTITDEKGEPLPGVSISVKGTSIGTTTNEKGFFRLELTSDNAVLLISYVGYIEQEIIVRNQADINIQLQPSSKGFNEVIVTGVFDKRTAMQSSIAISVVSAATISQQSPVSAADLLKNVPGVYVNSSLGEIRNTVYSRGVSAGSVEASTGYYYVSMQEDGLPVTNITSVNYGPDYFLRSDATIGRLEAVRGGSASIVGPNAPGGIFNYISKTGEKVSHGYAGIKLGLEGNAQPYYRTDLNFGGSLNKKGNLTYDIGGFYRYSNGVRYPGYPMNKGGQIKGNIFKKYKNGSFKVYAKYLNDQNGWFEFLPANDFSNPKLSPGVKSTDTYLPSGNFSFSFPENSANNIKDFDTKKLAHAQDRAIGMEWNHSLGNGWTINNNMKYSNKTMDWNSGAIISPVSVSGFFPYVFSGTMGKPGTYTFKDLVSGQTLATVSSVSGFDHTVSSSSLPGQNIQANSVLLQGLIYYQDRVNEFMDQFSINKKIKNMNITAGGFLGMSHLTYTQGFGGVAFGTIENNPHPIGITLTDAGNNIYQATNPQGIARLGSLVGGGSNYADLKQNQKAFFLADNWQINSKLNLDLGTRLDNVRVKGTNTPGIVNTSIPNGGLDGNIYTIYDQKYGATGSTYNIDQKLTYLSYSIGLNYKISNNYAIYGRFSNGKKAPDLSYYIGANTDFAVKNLDPQPQSIKQFEMGFKVQQNNLKVALTPFYSMLGNIVTSAIATNVNGTNYNTPVVYNKIETFGLEAETDYSFNSHFSARAVLTFQRAIAKDWKVWIVGNPGPQDDKTQDYSGNKADNNPDIMGNLTVNYKTENFYSFISWKYMGNRPANVPNTFTLKAFSQFDCGAGYDLNKHWKVSANINNIFDGNGVMSWGAPGGFPASLDRQGFTPDKLAANPNATFTILTIQPRSVYLTVSYNF